MGMRSLWLMSWAEGDDRPDGDRFLGRLPDWLRIGGLEIGFLYNPVVWLKPIDGIAAAVARSRRQPTALVGQFVGLGSLIRCYASLLVFPLSLKRRLVMAGIDLTRLARLALRRELASSRLPAAALYAYLAPGLKRSGTMPRALFYTYENQPWEKTMLAGFRRVLPSTILVGVQHAPLAERYLGGHPSARQWRDGTAPDLLVTVGPEFQQRLIALGAPSNRILVGGALRYTDLLATSSAPAARESDKARLVLATCSMDPRDSLELAYKAIVATTALAGVRLVINFHPMTEAGIRATLHTCLTKLADCQHVDFVEGSAAQWLERSDILLYSSSNTAFEAAAIGVPVIFVGSDIMLDADVMSAAATPKRRSAEDLRHQINELISSASKRAAAIEAGRSHLTRCLAVPKADFWTALAKQAVSGRLQ
jgi:hypothetical protein